MHVRCSYMSTCHEFLNAPDAPSFTLAWAPALACRYRTGSTLGNEQWSGHWGGLGQRQERPSRCMLEYPLRGINLQLVIAQRPRWEVSRAALNPPRASATQCPQLRIRHPGGQDSLTRQHEFRRYIDAIFRAFSAPADYQWSGAGWEGQIQGERQGHAKSQCTQHVTVPIQHPIARFVHTKVIQV